MGDAGEGLVDAESRIQERLEEQERERRGTVRRAGSARLRIVVLVCARPGAKPAPCDGAGEAQLLEVVRVVARDACREDVRFPGARCA